MYKLERHIITCSTLKNILKCSLMGLALPSGWNWKGGKITKRQENVPNYLIFTQEFPRFRNENV